MSSSPERVGDATPLAGLGDPVGDGREDFNFLFGDWRTANRRLVNPLDATSRKWEEFDAVTVARPVLQGLGNQDSITSQDGPGGLPFQGITLRLFNPVDGLWRIWWASTRRPGHLDEPMQGRFEGPEGVFYGRDVSQGQTFEVRFVWNANGPVSARWEQAFSFDGRRTWVTNWIMSFSRNSSGQFAAQRRDGHWIYCASPSDGDARRRATRRRVNDRSGRCAGSCAEHRTDQRSTPLAYDW